MRTRSGLLTPWLAALLVAAAAGRPVYGQLPGDPLADRARIAELLGDRPSGGDTSRRAIQPMLPHILFVFNSAFPFSVNDGPLWAGRGSNVSITGGGGGAHDVGRRSCHGDLRADARAQPERPVLHLPLLGFRPVVVCLSVAPRALLRRSPPAAGYRGDYTDRPGDVRDHAGHA